MVATLLRIRFRVLANTLAQSPWQLIGFIAGAIWGLIALLLAIVGLVYAGSTGLDGARLAIIAGGAALTLGWVLAPVFAAGVDTTLDPARLGAFPLTTTRMMSAITLAGLTGVPGIVTSLAALATFAAWFRWPVAAVAAVVFVPLGVLICVVASRALAALVGGMSGARRTREVFTLLVFAALMLAAPLVAGLTAIATASGSRLAGVIEVVSWTPLGAAWSVPGDLAAGDPAAAVAKALIATATLTVLWAIWHRSLAASLVSRSHRAASKAKAGSLGWFGRMPTGGAGATWARSLTYWLHDPRYLRQLVIVPAVPVLVLFYARGDATSIAIAFCATIVAFAIGIVPYADVSYDGTAFGTVLATGIRGRDDRLGRTLAALCIALPLTLIVAVVTVAITREWALLPAVIGSAVCMLLVAYGVCAVTSAYIVVPVPDAGDNPFKRVPGATFSVFLAFMGIWIAAGLLASPAIVLAIYATVSASAVAAWTTLAVGLAIGVTIFVIGITVGGRSFDRRAPELMGRVRAIKGV